MEKSYTSGLVWLNFGFLSRLYCFLSVQAYWQNTGQTHICTFPMRYVTNICFTGFMNCWLWLYASAPKRNLLTHTSAARIQLGLYRSLVVPLVFVLAFLISFFTSGCLPVYSHTYTDYAASRVMQGLGIKAKYQRRRSPQQNESACFIIMQCLL